MTTHSKTPDQLALEDAHGALLAITATLAALSPIKDEEQEYSRQKAMRIAASAALRAEFALRGF
ncbi:hypothetical protein AAGQ96_12955 [Pantoea sp. MBD-2R]|uniref:hypothetical protein n=1 Tax=Erwiniaceae TaxID=1903409 RepID=UPI001FEF5F3C|nr:hypothetical protein [Erwinia phyllosphaerae]MBV4365886.1 hypothetical protein [Erwinia phyllosphaerae]